MSKPKSPLCLAAEITGIPYNTLWQRVSRGMTLDQALTVEKHQGKYTSEIKNFIFENNSGISAKNLAELVNKKFGTSFTSGQMKNFRKRHKLVSGLTGRFEKGDRPFTKNKTWDEFMPPESQARSRTTTFKNNNTPHNLSPIGTEAIRFERSEIRIASEQSGIAQGTIRARLRSGMSFEEAVSNPVRQPLPQHIKDYIHKNYQGIGNKQLAQRIRETLGFSITDRQVEAYKSRNRLDSGIKGNTGYGSPAGSEWSHKGYVWVKVSNPNGWRPKHHILFEEYNNQKVPKGHIVTFLDGNRRNFSKENLVLITKAENKTLNQNGFRSGQGEVTKAGIAIAKLKATIVRKERGCTYSDLKASAAKSGLHICTVQARIKRGWSLDQAVTLPPYTKTRRKKYGCKEHTA